MKVSIIVATFGDLEWEKLAQERAMPSAHAQDPHSVVSVHLHEGTLAEARNLGAEDASGDWLCFLDADDELAPGYLGAMEETERVLASFYPPYGKQPAPSWLGLRQLLVPAVQYVRGEGREDAPRVLNEGRPLHELNNAVIGTLIPRALFLEVGGFREFAAYEDWELWLRCQRAGAKLIDVPNAVYRVFLRRGSRNQPQLALYAQIRAEYEP